MSEIINDVQDIHRKTTDQCNLYRIALVTDLFRHNKLILSCTELNTKIRIVNIRTLTTSKEEHVYCKSERKII